MSDQLFKRKKATQKSLARQKANRRTKSRVLITTEGAETEVLYIRSLEQQLGLDNVKIDLHGECGSAPSSVVEYAIEKVKSTKEDFGDYDLVLCVFDKDQHSTYQTALTMIAQANSSKQLRTNFKSIVSIPCFEVWLIFHFTYKRAPISGTNGRTDAKEAVHMLSKIASMSGYSKRLTVTHLNELMGRYKTAKKHAEQAWNDFLANGGDNPTTEMHLLIDFLKELNDK